MLTRYTTSVMSCCYSQQVNRLYGHKHGSMWEEGGGCSREKEVGRCRNLAGMRWPAFFHPSLEYRGTQTQSLQGWNWTSLLEPLGWYSTSHGATPRVQCYGSQQLCCSLCLLSVHFPCFVQFHLLLIFFPSHYSSIIIIFLPISTSKWQSILNLKKKIYKWFSLFLLHLWTSILTYMIGGWKLSVFSLRPDLLWNFMILVLKKNPIYLSAIGVYTTDLVIKTMGMLLHSQ